MMSDRSKIRFVDYGRAVCNSDEAFQREWLVTNGIGGYACGTLGGIRTRRYHAAFVAATTPPAVRTLLMGETAPTATYRGIHYPLSANRWKDGSISPQGHVWLQRFHLDGMIPTWRWSFSDALLERRIFMIQGENTVCQHWTLVQGSSPIQLHLEILVDNRSHHQLGTTDAATPVLERAHRGIRLSWPASRHGKSSEGSELFVQCDKSVPTPIGTWWRDFLLTEEQARGYDSIDCLWNAAAFEVVIEPGASALFTASTTAQESRINSEALIAEQSRSAALLATAAIPEDMVALRQLVLAADQFIVRRARKGSSELNGLSIIAGYPWFADWSRDAMISIPGLLLATNRVADAQKLLSTYADFVDQGMLPNRFPDRFPDPGVDAVEFNSVDAPLLMIIAAGKTFAAGQDRVWLAEIWPALQSIVDAYLHGTRHGIGVDPKDGLVRAGEAGMQLTWMDAKVGDHVITPRIGKPIEVNAFWYQALVAMRDLAVALDRPTPVFEQAAARVRTAFSQFWNHEHSCCSDVIDSPDGVDDSIRPNQLFAAALDNNLLPQGQRQAIIDLTMTRLWTPQGLRTLDPKNPAYKGNYGGDPQMRDGAYHQGTVWPWLFLPMVQTHFGVYADRTAIDDFLFPFANHLREAGMGSVSEIFSGDPPHQPSGCIAQAWSVAALLELIHFMRSKVLATASPSASRATPPSQSNMSNIITKA